MTTLPEFFIQKWESELPAFGKVLRAIPGDQLEYRPHERSASAGGIAWQLAIEQSTLAEMLQRSEVQWDTRKHPESLDEIVAEWDKATETLRERLKGLDDAKYASSTKLMMGEHGWSDSVGNMLWGFLVDMIHHRGQLSAYLRPMGGKVPAIYGPSAD
ncbi:MAG TPA: DinB family protein, partial [Thermoanaerobaculia bacterium]|nr:DinB family protein [Thermoanaerobaculia bacterium]